MFTLDFEVSKRFYSKKVSQPSKLAFYYMTAMDDKSLEKLGS